LKTCATQKRKGGRQAPPEARELLPNDFPARLQDMIALALEGKLHLAEVNL